MGRINNYFKVCAPPDGFGGKSFQEFFFFDDRESASTSAGFSRAVGAAKGLKRSRIAVFRGYAGQPRTVLTVGQAPEKDQILETR